MYNYEKANEIISEFMKREDDYKSIDKLIPVWQQISGVLWDMEGFNFETSFDQFGVSDVWLTSNWQGKGMGGYSDAVNYDNSSMDDENNDLTVQERALIVTATLILYEINKDYETDLSHPIKYSGETMKLMDENIYFDFSLFKNLARDDEERLVKIIKERQLLSHMMESALEALGFYGSKTDENFNLIKSFANDSHSRVRRGSHQGMFSYRKEKDLISYFKELMKTEKLYYNKNELERHLRTINRELEEKNNE